MRSLLLLLLLYVTSIAVSFAQDSTIIYRASILGAASGEHTPFWLNANQYGSIPNQGSFVSGQFSTHRVYNPNNPRIFQWSGGAELIATAGKHPDLFFTDLFLAGKAGPIELGIGQRKMTVGLADSTLSTGSIAISPNARPYPRIWLGTSRFVSILPGNDFISFQFTYSDGVFGPAETHFGNVPNVPKTYLHHKMLYLKVGGRNQKLNLYGGFNHQAMWGSEDIIFSNGLKRAVAYKYVIFGKPWAKSRVGNHFGTIDLGLEWHASKWEIFMYRQSIYEDGSLIDLSNIQDGLAGLRFKNISKNYGNTPFRLNTILLEYLHTKNQGGPEFDYDTGVFGMDNYFNHYLYSQGWSYRGRTLGTAMIAPQEMVRENLKTSSTSFTANNRLSAFHVGVDMSVQKINVIFKGTFSSNIGLYKDPFEAAVSQTSLLLKAEFPINFLGGSYLSAHLAADRGALYPDNTAVMIGWRKSGFIK